VVGPKRLLGLSSSLAIWFKPSSNGSPHWRNLESTVFAGTELEPGASPAQGKTPGQHKLVGSAFGSGALAGCCRGGGRGDRGLERDGPPRDFRSERQVVSARPSLWIWPSCTPGRALSKHLQSVTFATCGRPLAVGGDSPAGSVDERRGVAGRQAGFGPAGGPGSTLSSAGQDHLLGNRGRCGTLFGCE